jgi:hypothetical protein
MDLYAGVIVGCMKFENFVTSANAPLLMFSHHL